MKKNFFNIKLNFKIGVFTFFSLFFLYLLYLSIPSLYDSGRVQKVLYNKLIDEFSLNLSLSSDITYRILPQPHFYIKDTKIFRDKTKVSEEIGEVKDLKIDGLFVAIGHDPATKIFKDKINMDNEGWPAFLKEYYYVDTILRANGELWMCNEIKTIDYVEVKE